MLALDRGYFWLIHLKREHLPTNAGTVAGVEWQQLAQFLVPARSNVFLDECARQIAAAGRLQLHRQKGYFACHVAVAKPLIELDPVQERQSRQLPGTIDRNP